MDRAVILPVAGAADRGRLTRYARAEITGVDRPIVQHDVVCDGVDVAPHDDLARGQSRRVRRERLCPLDRDDVDRHDAGTTRLRRWTGRRPAAAGITAAAAGQRSDAE